MSVWKQALGGPAIRTRCAFAEDVCARREPSLVPMPDAPAHDAACHMLAPGSGHSRAA